MFARRTLRVSRRPLRLQTLEDRLAPATFTVTNSNNSGVGSLRQAVLDANSAAGADQIVFSSYFNVPRTITLTSEIGLTGEVTIDGPSAGLLTINAGNNGRHFNMTPSAGNVVSLSGMTLVNGKAAYGGAIAATCDLILSDVDISKCSATDFYNAKGGGVFAGGFLTATNCTFSENSTAPGTYFTSFPGESSGGGIFANNGLLLQASTVSGNSANGGFYDTGYPNYFDLYFPGTGGGISATGSTVIQNCTISGNYATFRSGISADALLVENSTIVSNGIWCSDLTIESSIVDKTTGIDATTVAAKTSSIYHYPFATTFIDLGGNRPFGEDARLGPLQNNGGPTKTHLLLPGSPCIDTGSNPENLSTDQRGIGFARVIDGVANMGAVEGVDVIPTALLISAPPTITAAGGTNYSVVIQYDDDLAIDLTTIGLDDIVVSGPGYAVPQAPTAFSVTGSGKSVSVTYLLPAPGGVFDLADDGLYTIAIPANQVADSDTPTPHYVAPGQVGTFRVAIPIAIVVDEISDIDDGNTSKGHVSLREAVRLTNTIANTADTISFDPAVFSLPVTIKVSGGALQVSDQLTVIGPGSDRLTLNGAGKNGLFHILMPGPGNLVRLSGMTLTNGLSELGGAIYAYSDLDLTNMVISNSTAYGAGSGQALGGGVFVPFGTVTATNCTFIGNTANNFYNYGGAIYVDGDVILNACTVSGNLAVSISLFNGYGYVYYPGVGGGIVATGSVTIQNCTISGNKAGVGGGLSARTLVVQNSTITANTAGTGGGISAVTITLESSIVANNAASSGSEISAPSVSAKNCSVFSLAGITTFNDLGGNRPVGENPLLGPLADNGGPTKTHRLLPGSPCINAGSNATGLIHDQRGNARVVGAAADIGAYEVQAPAKFSSVVINGGAGQRSMVTKVTVNFNQHIGFTGSAAAAFSLNRVGDNAPVTLTAGVDDSGGGTAVTLTFTGGAVSGASLADGRYALHILANGFNAEGFDGNGNGIATGSPTDDYAFDEPASATPIDLTKIFRLFGDADGNGLVDGLDFGAFRNAFNTNSSIFDFDGSGVVDGLDFGQFRARFGVAI